MTLGCKNNGIRKSEFVANTLFYFVRKEGTKMGCQVNLMKLLHL